jgi:hypothetical protein
VEARLEGSDYPETYVSFNYLLEEIVEKLHRSILIDSKLGYFYQWHIKCENGHMYGQGLFKH